LRFAVVVVAGLCFAKNIHYWLYLTGFFVMHNTAMLAVVGWPVSELLAPDYMLQDGRAPSFLNGFNIISAAAVLTAFSAFGIFGYLTALRRNAGTKLGDKHLNDMAKIWNVGVAL
jgi:hypothetical protein